MLVSRWRLLVHSNRTIPVCVHASVVYLALKSAEILCDCSQDTFAGVSALWYFGFSYATATRTVHFWLRGGGIESTAFGIPALSERCWVGSAPVSTNMVIA